MIDMAQADRTLRQRTSKGAAYDWTQIISAGELHRGDKCVIRQSTGTPLVLRIEPQHSYKEWTGCFSWIA